MGMLTIDLSKYRDKFGQYVPPGRYTVQVDWTELDKSNAGNQMIVMGLTVMDGPYAGSALVDRLTLTDKAMFRLVNFLQALGIPTPRQRLQIDPDRWKGRRAVIDTNEETYQGQLRTRILGYMRLDTSAESERKDELDNIAASFETDPIETVEAESALGMSNSTVDADLTDVNEADQETARPTTLSLDSIEL